jgi:hypothetical protein
MAGEYKRAVAAADRARKEHWQRRIDAEFKRYAEDLKRGRG